MILFDSRDSGGSGKWSVIEAKPRVTGHFPDLPESRESNSIICHPLDQSLYVFLYLHYDNTKLSYRIQTVQTFVNQIYF